MKFCLSSRFLNQFRDFDKICCTYLDRFFLSIDVHTNSDDPFSGYIFKTFLYFLFFTFGRSNFFSWCFTDRIFSVFPRKEIFQIKFFIEIVSKFTSIHGRKNNHQNPYDDKCNNARKGIINTHPYIIEKYFSSCKNNKIETYRSKCLYIFLYSLSEDNKREKSPVNRNSKSDIKDTLDIETRKNKEIGKEYYKLGILRNTSLLKVFSYIQDTQNQSHQSRHSYIFPIKSSRIYKCSKVQEEEKYKENRVYFL